MQHLLATCFVILVMNIAVHILFKEDMLLGWLRIGTANALDFSVGKRIAKIVQQPLWDCLTCMSSVWSIAWMLIFPNLRPEKPIYFLETMLVVCGIAAIVDIIFFADDE